MDMSGETEKEVSGWTVDTLHSHVVKMLTDLRTHIDQQFGAHMDALNALEKRSDQRFDAQEKRGDHRFDAQEKSVNAAISSAERAISKAEAAAEKRFDSVNEFRGQLKDQAATLLPRTEADQRFKSIEFQLVAFDQFRSQQKGSFTARTETKVTQMWAVGLVITIILATIAILVKLP